MATPFILGRDINGYNAFGVIPCDVKHMWNANLDQGTATSITLPSDAPSWSVVFSIQSGTDVWVSYTTTATAPGSGTLSLCSSELNPVLRNLLAGTTISVVTSSTNAEIWIGAFSNAI